ncbi:MAG: hypothetical protein NZM10_01430, partial [Fimbriimonadales bacterium]|nr:hypothetical protein [Fimbriimonadales bacterium]
MRRRRECLAAWASRPSKAWLGQSCPSRSVGVSPTRHGHDYPCYGRTGKMPVPLVAWASRS